MRTGHSYGRLGDSLEVLGRALQLRAYRRSKRKVLFILHDIRGCGCFIK